MDSMTLAIAPMQLLTLMPIGLQNYSLMKRVSLSFHKSISTLSKQHASPI
jgi:hypothetical protein